jgi:tetratricopeptide (TPR) repeat protein
MNDEQRAQLTAYLKGLSEGRRATRAAKYSEARAAFTTALTARPGDSRAFAERGYAALLAKNYDAAESDLNQAATTTEDRKLRAQIFFNLGLVREAINHSPTPAFAISNSLHRTTAATAKLVGKDPCPVELNRSSNAAFIEEYRDWLKFYTARQNGQPRDTKPVSNEEARKSLCYEVDCLGTGPWIVRNEADQLWVSRTPNGLKVTTLGSTVEGAASCPPSLHAELLENRGGQLIFRLDGTYSSPAIYCGEGGDHDCSIEELDQINQDPSSMSYIRGCSTMRFTEHKVLDTANGRWNLSVILYESNLVGLKDEEQTHVTVEDEGIRVKGPECNQMLPVPTRN